MKAVVAIIEDNPDNLELITYILHKYGYVTITANDGLQGLEMVKREKPHLILCDIQLPNKNGYEIAQELKNSDGLSNIPIIAVTAFSVSLIDGVNKIEQAGFNAHIRKPINPETFISEIERFIPLENRSEGRH